MSKNLLVCIGVCVLLFCCGAVVGRGYDERRHQLELGKLYDEYIGRIAESDARNSELERRSEEHTSELQSL